MIIRVHHASKNLFTETVSERSSYRAVADVYVVDHIPVIEALDYAFKDTNHIDDAWWKNNTVTKLVPEFVRSTSVGDIVEHVESGKFWICAGVGWLPVSEFPSNG